MTILGARSTLIVEAPREEIHAPIVVYIPVLAHNRIVLYYERRVRLSVEIGGTDEA